MAQLNQERLDSLLPLFQFKPNPTSNRQPADKAPIQIEASPILDTIAQGFQLSINELLAQSVHLFLQSQVRQIKAEIFALHSRYNVTSVEEMDALYTEGTLNEADSWQDLQHLDYLEYERDRLTKLLESLT
ncbi:MAG: hypothetical protein AAF639_12095 [Chloroflexota bacterium]